MVGALVEQGLERVRAGARSLQIESVRLYNESGYAVPPNTAAMNQQDNAVFQSLLRGAPLVPAP